MRTSLTLFAGIAAVAALGLFIFLHDPVSVSGEEISPPATADPGPLDGMTFVGALGPYGQPKDVEDVFVFENGSFVSKECEVRCQYPPRPYFIRKVDGKIEFVSETKCPYKDAKIVWRGTVDGNTLSGVATWTVRRWYWTVENRFEFSGKLERTESLADARP
jgi:hypothetical protein